MKTIFRPMASGLLLAAASFCVQVLPAAAGDQPGPLNQRILDYCNQHMGQSVGNGECAALAVMALRAAGARPKSAKGYPAWNDYVWGKEVCMIEGTPEGTKVVHGSLADVEPGDIAQYSQVKFLKMHAKHHTSIVEYIKGNRMGNIHQNMGGTHGRIAKGGVRVDKLMEGWIRFYRPIP